MTNTSYNYQAPVARQGDLAVKELPEEVLVYDLKRHEAHCLNKTAALVWQHCDGRTDIRQLARLLEQEAGTPVDEEVVWYALDKLKKADLLEGALDLPVKDRLSRRRMIATLGVLAVPAVLSLVAPPAFAGASVVVLDYKIPTGQCTTQGNPVNCDDRCCTGNNPDDPGDRKSCVGAGTTWSCTGPACVTTGPSRSCTPSSPGVL